MSSPPLNRIQPQTEAVVAPPHSGAAALDGHGADLDAHEYIYHIQTSHSLPSVDLSHTLSRRLFSAALHRAFLRFTGRHFHHLVMIYRVGVVDLGVLLFLPPSALRTVLSIVILPCSLSVFTSVFFMSMDLVQLLTQCYEFWFLVFINVCNWILLATILPDVRALLCWSAWLSYQTVILIDANYRTYPTALVSTAVSTPLVIAIAVLVAAQSLRNGNYYAVYVETYRVCDAADLIAFTTSTLTFFLGKMVVLKRLRVHRTFDGVYSIPCVVIKAVLRFEPATARPLVHHQPYAIASATRGPRQHLLVSTPPLAQLDAFRTVLPHRVWKRATLWSSFRCRVLRGLFYSIGGIGLVLVSFSSLSTFHQDWRASQASTHNVPRHFGATTPTSKAMAVTASVCSVIFCGGFALFYQRDLLRLLCRNFDFVFCVGQTLAYVLCDCDLVDWTWDRSMTLLTWCVWALWTLTLDAATPIIKHHVFRFQKRWAAPVLATTIAGVACRGLFIVFLPGMGLHDRVLWSYEFSSTARFTICTKSLLLGRVVTINLWCTRQAFLLLTRRNDELNFVHGSIEYLSPYSHFPFPKNNAINIEMAADG